MLAKSDSFRVTGCYNGTAYPHFNFSFSPPLASDFTVYQLTGEYCDLFFVGLGITADYSFDCEGIRTYVNSKTEPFYASFTSGGEYASFYNWDTWENLGDNISGLITEFNNIIVGFDEPYLGTGDTYIVRQWRWGDKIKTDSVRLISALAAQVVVEYSEYNLITGGGFLDVYLQAKNSTGDCDGFFSPPDVTYSLEIISGNQYGNLINPFTNEKNQSIIGLEQIDGFSYFYYSADGISADDTVEAVIRISTSDLNIPYTDFTVYIIPSPIYVYTVPEVLGADDTADVIIKYKDVDGTLYDFPTEQTFELAVLDGCVNGNFMVNDSINVYFADAVQPIKFVTADSLDPEFDEVLMRTGTNIWGYFGPIGNIPEEEEKNLEGFESAQIGIRGKTLKERREKFDKLIAERKAEEEAKAEAEAKKKEESGGEPLAPVVPICAPNIINYLYTYSHSNVLVQGGCDEYICNEVILKPSFSFEHYPNGTFNEDPCTVEQSKHSDRSVSGVFSPLWNRTIITAIEYFKMENLTACYQPINGKWAFGTRLPSYPYYQAIMDVCLTNITNRGYRYLYDISEIQSKWNDPDICKAKKDLEGHKKYPSEIRTGGYIFIDVKMAHEMAHGQDFQWVIDSLQTAFLYPALDLLEVTCGKYDEENRKANSDDYAKSIYFKYLQKVIAGEKSGEQVTFLGFEDRLYEGYNNHINQSYTVNGKQVDHENYINSLPIVTNTINVLISEFKNIWNCN